MPREEAPRLEKVKHFEAEQRLRTSILEGKDYPGKDEDLDLVRRKERELGRDRVRRIVGGGA